MLCAFCCESVAVAHLVYKDTFKQDTSLSLKLQKRKVKPSKKLFLVSKQTGILSQATECSYKKAECMALKGKPFTDGEYIKETFLKC